MLVKFEMYGGEPIWIESSSVRSLAPDRENNCTYIYTDRMFTVRGQVEDVVSIINRANGYVVESPNCYKGAVNAIEAYMNTIK